MSWEKSQSILAGREKKNYSSEIKYMPINMKRKKKEQD